MRQLNKIFLFSAGILSVAGSTINLNTNINKHENLKDERVYDYEKLKATYNPKNFLVSYGGTVKYWYQGVPAFFVIEYVMTREYFEKVFMAIYGDMANEKYTGIDWWIASYFLYDQILEIFWTNRSQHDWKVGWNDDNGLWRLAQGMVARATKMLLWFNQYTEKDFYKDSWYWSDNPWH